LIDDASAGPPSQRPAAAPKLRQALTFADDVPRSLTSRSKPVTRDMIAQVGRLWGQGLQTVWLPVEQGTGWRGNQPASIRLSLADIAIHH
jgi:hypothetical protein